MWVVWCTCCTQPAFCHLAIDGIGNDLCSSRRSLFLGTPSIAQLSSSGAQLFHFSTTWWIVSLSCLFPISLWKAPFWPLSHRWAADNTRLGSISSGFWPEKIWFHFEVCWNIGWLCQFIWTSVKWNYSYLAASSVAHDSLARTAVSMPPQCF